VAAVIKFIGTDPHLMRLLRDTGLPCVTAPREALAGLAHANAAQPAVLVVDLRDHPEFPTELTSVKRQHPTTSMLLVVPALDPALMLAAMRAGVNEILAHPVSDTELHTAIKRLVGSQTPAVRGEVYAFVGAKGGVGTTTIAVNVASALARPGAEAALLIDLNTVCGDAAVFLGLEPRFSVMDALQNVQRLDAAYFGGLVARAKFGLDLLGASSRPATTTFDTGRMRTLLEFASQSYRYAVLDVPRSDASALDALEGTTKIVLVVNQELATVRNASRMATTLRERYGQGRLSLVLTRTDRRAEIGLDDVERTVGLEVSHSFPSDYRLALQAMNKGRPIALDPQTELAGAFLSFARTLSGTSEKKVKEEKTRAESQSLFGRLAPRKA
jgi:pilus assembly protein CpaE